MKNLKNFHDVTVITAVYNTERFIREAVESVASQTLLPYEHLLIDDASTDKSLNIAIQLANEYSHVRVIRHKNNKGYPSALNSGIKGAKTNYVAILDSDDIAMYYWLETAMSIFSDNPNLGAVGGGCEIIKDNGEATGYMAFCDATGIVTDQIKLNQYMLLHAGVVYNKSVIESFGGYNQDLRSLEDNDIFLNISSVSDLYHAGVPFIYYRRMPGSESRKTKEFSAAAEIYLKEKANLLKLGYTVDEANEAINSLSQNLKTIPRLAPLVNGLYELEMARAFATGGRKFRALKECYFAFKSGANPSKCIRCMIAILVPNLVKKIIRNVFTH